MNIQFEKFSNDEYHKHPAIGSTQLKYAMDSLAKFNANYTRPFNKTSESMELGTCAHAAILERDFDRYIAGPAAAKNTKAWKDFVEANPKKIVLKPDLYLAVKEMYDTFFRHELAPKLIAGGIPEATFLAKIHGYYYKARPDYLVIGEDDIYMVDYKTCRSCKYEEFQKAILNYGYDLSAAHYMRVFYEATAKSVSEYYWVAQETEAPYEIAVYRMDEECRGQAIKTVNKLYENVAWGFNTGEWPKRQHADILDIDLPTWAIDKGARRVETITSNPE